MCFRFTKTLWPGGIPRTPTRRSHAGAMGRGAPDRITGWRTRATRPPPTVQPSLVRLHPVSVASIIRREDVEFPGRETRNRGYSYPSWGRVRALQAIPRPRIPPDRPQNARMAVSAVFRASGGHGAWMPATSRPKTHPRADPQARAGQGQAPGGPSRITSAGVVGQDGATLGRRPRDGFREVEHLPGRRSRGGPETPGSEGAEPPASLRRGRTECGPTEYAGLSPIVPKPAGGTSSSPTALRQRSRAPNPRQLRSAT